ncbi:MAG: mucoidy inhibitor MuiA family protein [Flavobacteriia bacterium]
MNNKIVILVLTFFLVKISSAQNETVLSSNLDKVTVFFQGAQLEHTKAHSLKPGKQTLIFEKLTDFLDQNTIQMKATGNLTILSVSMRKNYEDKRISNLELKTLNEQLEKLKTKDKTLRDEHFILQTDKNLLSINSQLRGNDKGVIVSELKEAYTFIHARMVEISKRETEIEAELVTLNKEINKIAQEIDAQRGKPVVNYSEIVVEVDVMEETNANFIFSYISPKASWKPYYDLRSDGVGMPIKMEAKAFVNQETGIAWKNVDLTLSTNDPYQNSNEIDLKPWYLNYNNYPQNQYTQARTIPAFDYSGQKIRGEVIDASTGNSMPFAKVYFSSYPNLNVVTDFDGKFEITVPKGERYLNANYVGYSPVQIYVNSPYVKFFLSPEGLVYEEVEQPVEIYDAITSDNVSVSNISISEDAYYSDYEVGEKTLEEVQIVSEKRSRKLSITKEDIKKMPVRSADGVYSTQEGVTTVQTTVVEKDLRVEYQIQSKFSIESDGMDQRVQIATYELPSNYEYHAVPKVDPAVYLVAQVSGWEKLNLLSGESNIYFDGTFIGKNYIDVNSTKDTLSFSLGKDSKVQVLRTRLSEKSSTKAIGSRQKFEVAWEIKVKNNGGAEIPLLIKDQFPISVNEDIKVKRGDYSNGKLDDKTGIITWQTTIPKTQSKSFFLDYSVDYKKGMVIYLE